MRLRLSGPSGAPVNSADERIISTLLVFLAALSGAFIGGLYGTRAALAEEEVRQVEHACADRGGVWTEKAGCVDPTVYGGVRQ